MTRCSEHFSHEAKTYSESKYSVESVSGKYLENGWSDQHRDLNVEFVIEKFKIPLWNYNSITIIQLQTSDFVELTCHFHKCFPWAPQAV